MLRLSAVWGRLGELALCRCRSEGPRHSCVSVLNQQFVRNMASKSLPSFRVTGGTNPTPKLQV